jgi:hypothetical protein
MTSFPAGRGTVRIVIHRGVAAALVAFCAALVATGAALAKDGDGRAEIKVAGSCGTHATSKLKLQSRDRIIELEFEVDDNRAGVLWRVALVHERRVAWRGTARTSGSSGSFAVDRRITDLPGPDTVTARAWGPTGITCRATATLPGA